MLSTMKLVQGGYEFLSSGEVCSCSQTIQW